MLLCSSNSGNRDASCLSLSHRHGCSRKPSIKRAGCSRKPSIKRAGCSVRMLHHKTPPPPRGKKTKAKYTVAYRYTLGVSNVLFLSRFFRALPTAFFCLLLLDVGLTPLFDIIQKAKKRQKTTETEQKKTHQPENKPRKKLYSNDVFLFASSRHRPEFYKILDGLASFASSEAIAFFLS